MTLLIKLNYRLSRIARRDNRAVDRDLAQEGDIEMFGYLLSAFTFEYFRFTFTNGANEAAHVLYNTQYRQVQLPAE